MGQEKPLQEKSPCCVSLFHIMRSVSVYLNCIYELSACISLPSKYRPNVLEKDALCVVQYWVIILVYYWVIIFIYNNIILGYNITYYWVIILYSSVLRYH